MVLLQDVKQVKDHRISHNKVNKMAVSKTCGPDSAPVFRRLIVY